MSAAQAIGAATGGPCLRGVVEGAARRARVLGGVPGRYALLSLFGQGRALVCLERAGGLELPISITLARELIDDALGQPNEVVVGRGGVRTRGGWAQVQSWRDDRVRLAGAALDSGAVATMSAGLAASPAPEEPAAVHEAVAAFCRALLRGSDADLAVAADAMIGLGLGSTPACDDVLAAATATLHATVAARPAHPQPLRADPASNTSTGPGTSATAASTKSTGPGTSATAASTKSTGPGTSATAAPSAASRLSVLCSVIAGRAERTTPLSAALLRSAAQGRAIAPLRRAVSAASTGQDPHEALRGLLAVGHSSGYFLAAGALAAARAALDKKSGTAPACDARGAPTARWG